MIDEFLKIIDRPEFHRIGMTLSDQPCPFCGVGRQTIIIHGEIEDGCDLIVDTAEICFSIIAFYKFVLPLSYFCRSDLIKRKVGKERHVGLSNKCYIRVKKRKGLTRWIYTKKVDTKQDFILHFSKHKGGMVSMTHRPYDEDFKKSIVALYQNGKTQSQLSKEYGVSLSAIGKWIRLYSEVKTVDGDIMTAKQIKDLQRRNAQLEEENLILKKAIAIFTPHSNND